VFENACKNQNRTCKIIAEEYWECLGGCTWVGIGNILGGIGEGYWQCLGGVAFHVRQLNIIWVSWELRMGSSIQIKCGAAPRG